MTITIDSDRQVSDAAFAEDWRAWHLRHQAIIGDPHGFLAITSLHWLDGTPHRFADAPGAWFTDSDGVHVDLADGEEILIAGEPTRGRHDFGVIQERASITVGWGEAVIQVAKRGGFGIVRPRHPDAPLVTAYHGTPAYEPDQRWVTTGHFVPFDAPRPTTVGAAVEGLQHVYQAPGTVEFALGGKPYALTVFDNEHGAGYLALFTDATSGVTTYAANRSLRLAGPAADGTVVVDFNRATNLPCAYTDLATCPLPPAENRLPIPIEAGEKIPYERLAEH